MALSALASFISEGLEELEADLSGDISNSFTWKGATIACVPNMQGESRDLVFGGHENVADFSLIVLMRNFVTADSTLITVDSELFTADNDTPRPVAGKKTIGFRGKNYKILSATVDSTGAYVRLILGDVYSGRG